jgi:hypothetical protein
VENEQEKAAIKTATKISKQNHTTLQDLQQKDISELNVRKNRKIRLNKKHP